MTVRGIILTAKGRKKLEDRIRELIADSKSGLTKGNAPALAVYFQLKGLSHPSETTIRFILNGRGVDERLIKLLFKCLDLICENGDYEYSAKRNPPPPPPIPESTPQNIPRSGVKEFIGRENILSDIHNLFDPNSQKVRPVALIGMGGVGKTELAIQYARQYAQLYTGGVCWVFVREMDIPNPDGGTIAAQIESFAQLRVGVTIPDNYTTPYDRVTFCWQNWEKKKKGDVLLIFDDVDKYSDIADYLPNDTRFKVLLTTRLELGPPVQKVGVEVLDREDSLALLASLIEDDRVDQEDDANKLCEFLGDLPLAIELCGRYLALDSNIPVAFLLDQLNQRAEKRQTPKHDALRGDRQTSPNWSLTAHRGLEAAFDLTWERLDPKTQLLAKIFGRFEPAPIRWLLVEATRQGLAEDYPEDGEYYPEELHGSRTTLILFNLIKPFDQQRYRLHPLTREFFRSKTTDEEYERYGGDT